MSVSGQPACSAQQPSPLPARERRDGQPQSYGQILWSSAMIGGSSVVRIGISILRTKALALMLGPAGVGLLGLYSSIADLVQSVSSMGINSSGVRQIAESVGSGDTARIGRTVTTLRRVALVLGALGALLLVGFCRPVARFSFGDERYAGGVALLALAVFCGAVSAGQIALVQGMRRIGDLARANVFGALYGTLSGVLIVYFMGERGVVPSLVCVAATSTVTCWWYSRKIQVERVRMRWTDVSAEVSGLLKLGFVLMISGLLMLGVAYLVRIIVLRRLGTEAAGFYQAAWALGGLYVGIILQAMGADFFPRLTAAAKDNAACNRMVNEQAEVSLLLAGPGVIATLTFAPVVIQLFYSAKFVPAVEVLRWICLGMMLRVASYPMAFIVLAKGARRPFFWSELLSSAVQVALVWGAVLSYGLKGTGIGFFGAYVFYWFLIYGIVRSVSGFRWSAANKRVGLIHTVAITTVFVGEEFLSPAVMLLGGGFIALMTGVYSLKRICSLVSLARLPARVQRWLVLLRLAPPSDLNR